MVSGNPETRLMRPDDILRIRWVSDPRLSADGTRVAYVVTTLDAERNEQVSHIHVVDVESGASRQLTNGPKRDTAPRWSPDGRHVVFVSERGEDKAQLWLIATDGGEAWQLTKQKDAVANPAWSPDGRSVAFTCRVEDRPLNGPDGKPVPKTRTIVTLKYKSNGEGFVHDKRAQIFVVDVDTDSRKTAAARKLTRGDFNHGPPVWSPDGNLLAFAAARHASRDRDQAMDLWVVPTAGGEPRKLTQTKGPVSFPAWSPDGSTIAYLGHTDKRAGGAFNHRLWAVPAAGGEPRCLTLDLDRTCATGVGPAWTKDGRHIVFGVMDHGNCHLHSVRADGGPPARIVGGERQIISAALSCGNIAFLASHPTQPAEVFHCSEDGRDEKRLTVENDAWLSEVTLAKPERFTVRSTDGTEVEAWVMRPTLTAEPSLPCLVNVHGGPHGQYGNVFFDEFQVYAGAGYVVVFGNPRGSQGYGQEFANAIQGGWGGKDWEDLQAIAQGIEGFAFVDPAKVGLMGGSYGGYMTSWAVGHSDQFAAACSERAVNNLYSMVGTSDIGSYFQLYETGGDPYVEPERYLSMSPISYVRDIHTPLLIIHSENDLRCPMEQAEQLYVGLKLLRRPVKFVRFPEENHEMSRSGKPKHRLERFGVILDWFDGRLKGDKPKRRS